MIKRRFCVLEANVKKILTWTVFGSFLAASAGACSSSSSNNAPAGGGATHSGGATSGGATSGGGASAGGATGVSGSGGAVIGAGAPGAGAANGGASGAATGGANNAGANTGGAGGAVGASGASTGGASGTGGGSTNVIAGLLALAKQPCANVVSQHDYNLDDGSKVSICATTGAGTNSGAIFWTGDMDIDCDGKSTTECNVNTDCCYQDDTAFHNKADEPLTASVTPYVVIPNDFKFAGLSGGTVIAVIYENKITYAVYGDTGPTDIIGEASYATAKSLGINPDAKVGGVGGKVVTYIAFLGKQAVPKDLEDRAEVEKLGPQLAQALLAK